MSLGIERVVLERDARMLYSTSIFRGVDRALCGIGIFNSTVHILLGRSSGAKVCVFCGFKMTAFEQIFAIHPGLDWAKSAVVAGMTSRL